MVDDGAGVGFGADDGAGNHDNGGADAANALVVLGTAGEDPLPGGAQPAVDEGGDFPPPGGGGLQPPAGAAAAPTEGGEVPGPGAEPEADPAAQQVGEDESDEDGMSVCSAIVRAAGELGCLVAITDALAAMCEVAGGVQTISAPLLGSQVIILGNQVTTNSSACSTGAEAIALGMERIRAGRAKRMLCGGAEAGSHYIWAGFDAMRVLCKGFNDEPEKASRPLSASAGGFVPGSGAGIVMLESLESAEARGATIHAEVLGSGINCGGHRGGGSMTAPNPESVRRCIQLALADAGLDASEVDAINGHLTATGADPSEIGSWAAALGREPGDLPTVTATKGLVGHTLGAAGAVESVATILMLRGGFVHPCVNCEDVHPEIEPYAGSIPHSVQDVPDLKVILKAGFGFGDVNACLAFRRWDA